MNRSHRPASSLEKASLEAVRLLDKTCGSTNIYTPGLCEVGDPGYYLSQGLRAMDLTNDVWMPIHCPVANRLSRHGVIDLLLDKVSHD